MSSEKVYAFASPPIQNQTPNLFSRRNVYTVVVAVGCLLWWCRGYIFLTSQHSLQYTSDKDDSSEIDWNVIEPSEKLEWTPCLVRFHCARLTLPMDYNRPLNVSQTHPKVHIALVMLMGLENSISGPFSTSPLMLGSGGPGGSGTRMIRSWGDRARFMAGSDQDVIGFDPRGIGASTPHTDCFSFDRNDMSLGFSNRMTWNAAGLQARIINSENDDALINLDGRIEAIAKLCKSKDELEGDASILKYVSTVNVIHDMANILDAWGTWTSTTLHQSKDSTLPVKLTFWGFSYGTLLGATFAAIYPDRINRVVLDGVLDVGTYINYSWKGHIQDLDKVLASFFQYCFLATERCALYRPNDSPSDLELRFHGIMSALRQKAITLISPNSMMPTIVTYGDVKEYLFQAMFSPVDDFPRVAQLLDAFDKVDTDFIAKELIPETSATICDIHQAIPILEAGQAVTCSDKISPLKATIPKLSAIHTELSNYSYFADVWMGQMIGCHHWNITARSPPFPFSNGRNQINTSFPLLFISNSADPVDPIEGGLNMTLKFRNAGFIEQKSEGHCSTSTTSHCTMSKVRSYFRDGVVPPAPILGKNLADGKWDRCERDEWPWKPFNEEEWKDNKISMIEDDDKASLNQIEEEASVIQAWKEMQHGFDGLDDFGL